MAENYQIVELNRLLEEKMKRHVEMKLKEFDQKLKSREKKKLLNWKTNSRMRALKSNSWKRI